MASTHAALSHNEKEEKKTAGPVHHRAAFTTTIVGDGLGGPRHAQLTKSSLDLFLIEP